MKDRKRASLHRSSEEDPPYSKLKTYRRKRKRRNKMAARSRKKNRKRK